ncbi:hypothetical protein UFOVP1382_9 [uncultured Caudovirales phage]|uniref:Uncharacterized protein n=1 Tax=uncultured Caudovirales phage TaxID=2100421 RepID=A0A6J5S3N3_9CAUD|nr:hypothetical protein UFOVP1382_9 [uncultured Caudovirales phage]
MTLRADYSPTIRVHGSHSTPGREGTTLEFVVFLTRYAPDEVVATLDVSTRGRDPKAEGDAKVRASAGNDRDALRRLSSYLRRCADAIDADITTILLPEVEKP